MQTVVSGSPAQKAGIQPGGAEKEFTGIPFRPGGDLIVAIDGIPVRTAEDVVRVVTEQLYPGETAHLTILRGGERLALDVVLGERPSTVP